MKPLALLILLLLLLTSACTRLAWADAIPVEGLLNFETPHVTPLALTPDGTRLLAVNTPANQLEVFLISGANLTPLASIPVGLDPVSVRARSNTEVWVVNHISDSISIIDLQQQTVVATLSTANEPADVVFAGSPERAFISCAQPNRVQVFDPNNLNATPTQIDLLTEDPRAMAVSADGTQVFVAGFESGNATTALNGRLGPIATGEILGSEDIISRLEGPYGGQNPPPNRGNIFDPPQNSNNSTPPPVSLIVRKNDQGLWMDDNNGDWSIFVSGALASLTRRTNSWDLPDRDVAIINTQTLSVQYQPRLMNMLMAMAVNPVTDEISVVGTDATNEIRYEPNISGTFLRVHLARFTTGGAATISDLNPHLDYQTRNLPTAQRVQSIGDPRGIAWTADGTQAFITGMGSNNVIVIDSNGARQTHIPVGEGPTGIVLHEASNRAFVLNKFDGTISTLSLSQLATTSTIAFFDPTPPRIKAGRPLLYNTHLTSGLGHIACASCHVDARTDRLAWDLGNPAGTMEQTLDGKSLHPMKGPMRTQSLQDIIAHPGMHWRGDRDDLNAFNPAFVNLMSADSPISSTDMQAFEDFLDTIHFPPNPFRNLDNSLPTSLEIPDGRIINASSTRDSIDGCLGCHTDNQTRASTTDSELSQAFIPPAFHGFYEHLGYFQERATGSTSGFGLFHDGADPLTTAARTPETLAAFMVFDGPDNGLLTSQERQDTHAAVGRQLTVNGAITTAQDNLLTQLITIANTSPHADLIAKARLSGTQRGFFLQTGNTFQSDRANETLSRTQLLNAALAGDPVTFTIVANGTAQRLGVDLNFNGVFDGDEGTVNSPPVVSNPGNQTHTEGDTVSLAINASDADGDSLTFSASGLPANLTINSSTGDITGLLAAASAGAYTVSVSVSDGQGSDATTFDWTVTPTGGGITCLGATATLVGTAGDDTLIGTPLDDVIVGLGGNDFIKGRGGNDRICGNDGDDELIGSSGSDQFDGGSGNDRISGGSDNDTLDGGAGTDVCRGNGGTDTASNCEEISEIENTTGNGAPSLTNPGDQLHTEGDTVSLPLSASDPEGDTLTFSATNLPSALTINSSSGEISGVLAPDSADTYAVTVTVTDGTDTDTDTFSWVVETSTSNAAIVNATFDTDPDGFTYLDDAYRNTNAPAYASGTYLPTGGLTGGGLQVLLGSIDDADIFGMSGAWQISFTLNTPQTLMLTMQYNMTQQPNYETNEFSQVLVSVNDNLVGQLGDDFVAQITGDNNGGTILSTNWQTFQADLGNFTAGTHTIRIGGYNNQKTFNDESTEIRLDDILITGTSTGNQPPIVTNPGNPTHNEGDTVSLTLSASDPDGDPLTFSATGLPNALTLNTTSGEITGVLAAGSAGTYPVAITVSDGNGGSDSVTITWTINTAGGSITCLGATATLVGTAGDDTLIGTPLDDVIVGLGGNDFIKGRGGNDRLCGNEGDDELVGSSGNDQLDGGSGNDSLKGGSGDDTLNGNDDDDTCRGNGGIDTGSNCETLSEIENISGNTVPSLVNPGDLAHTEGDTVSLTISASDSDGDPLTFSATGLPSALTINATSGEITGVLAASSAGTYPVIITVSDGNGGSDSITITWTVNIIGGGNTCLGAAATLVGTAGDDTLVGTNGDDVIVGLGGNDIIKGRGGNDRLCGNDGDDELVGSSGNDQLDGGSGNDLLRSGNGDDILDGGDGTDTCRGNDGIDTALNCEDLSNIP